MRSGFEYAVQVEVSSRRIAQVALDLPVDTLFDYLLPAGAAAQVGVRVVVPFAAKKKLGVVVAIASESDLPEARLKSVERVCNDAPPFAGSDMALFTFCRDYYHEPLGPIILSALPPGLRRTLPLSGPRVRRFQLTELGRTTTPQDISARAGVRRKVLQHLHDFDSIGTDDLLLIAPSAPAALRFLVQAGLAGPVTSATVSASEPAGAHGGVQAKLDGPVTRAGLGLSDPAGSRGDVPARLDEPGASALALAVSCAGADTGVTLNAEQRQAFDSVARNFDRFAVWLLKGVTGSGKTEVYLHLVQQALARGGQALLLVPEINLTPQLEAHVAARFPRIRLASLHSQLSERERVAHWLAIAYGDASIILGTRLAVFAPIPRLALIVVDEEHDSSFKQQDNLRYSARDVAIIRAKRQGIPIVLGSATPSLETYHHALTGRYRLLELKQRAAARATLPEMRLVDTRKAQLDDGLAEPLLQAIAARVARGEQSLLFINRRGYAPVLFCQQCGAVPGCTRCSTKLVVHLRDRQLRCHHCGHCAAIPTACPACGNADMKPLGHGTQRIEAALQQRFPGARVMRIDRDSTSRKSAWSSAQATIRAGEVDILVGTQILAKGHDFPLITLVGVLGVDGALYSPDFRAGERLFQQILQVAGRAGRASLPGQVLIQTQFPDHPLFRAVLQQDYDAFAKAQLSERKAAAFPPFVYQALLRVESVEYKDAEKFTTAAAERALALRHSVTVYDPVQAQIARLAGKSRMQLLLQSPSRQRLQGFLSVWQPLLGKLAAGKVRWAIDVDPYEI